MEKKKKKYFREFNNVYKYTNSGSKIVKSYRQIWDDDKGYILEEIGTYNLYDRIQETGKGRSLSEVLKKFSQRETIDNLCLEKTALSDNYSSEIMIEIFEKEKNKELENKRNKFLLEVNDTLNKNKKAKEKDKEVKEND